jgi:hypothetical protein
MPQLEGGSMKVAPTQKETETLFQRMALFEHRGLSSGEAEVLAYKLFMRDLSNCGAGACIECLYMAGHTMGHWKCIAPRHINNLGGLKLGAFEVYQCLHRCSTRTELL